MTCTRPAEHSRSFVGRPGRTSAVLPTRSNQLYVVSLLRRSKFYRKAGNPQSGSIPNRQPRVSKSRVEQSRGAKNLQDFRVQPYCDDLVREGRRCQNAKVCNWLSRTARRMSKRYSYPILAQSRYNYREESRRFLK